MIPSLTWRQNYQFLSIMNHDLILNRKMSKRIANVLFDELDHCSPPQKEEEGERTKCSFCCRTSKTTFQRVSRKITKMQNDHDPPESGSRSEFGILWYYGTRKVLMSGGNIGRWYNRIEYRGGGVSSKMDSNCFSIGPALRPMIGAWHQIGYGCWNIWQS